MKRSTEEPKATPENRHNAQRRNAGERDKQSRNASEQATQRAKEGEPLSPDAESGRSPKQENL